LRDRGRVGQSFNEEQGLLLRKIEGSAEESEGKLKSRVFVKR
jgi:hypothetical protein